MDKPRHPQVTRPWKTEPTRRVRRNVALRKQIEFPRKPPPPKHL